MKTLSATSPQWANAGQTTINLTVDFEGVGVVPFSASASDTEAHGRALFASAVAGDFGPIAAYVEPPATIPTVVTMRQARLAMLDAGILTSVSDALSAMTGPAGEAARIEWEYAAELKRDHPLVASLSAALGLTSAQLDGLFTVAAGL